LFRQSSGRGNHRKQVTPRAQGAIMRTSWMSSVVGGEAKKIRNAPTVRKRGEAASTREICSDTKWRI
jgi:hypothetical protein